MKIKSINDLLINPDSKNLMTNKDIQKIKGGQAEPPPWGNFTGG